ncbi:MAG: hypothetical protein ACLUFN_04320 [Eubacterium sp.]
MKIVFKNLSDDIDAFVAIGSNEFAVEKSSVYEFETNKTEVTFSVVYNRDFSADISDDKDNKILNWITDSIGNLLVQIKNTYHISDLIDGDVIKLNERAHYVPTTKKEAFYKCLPALYYFGEAECENTAVEIVSSNAVNRDEFIKVYKKFLKVMNLSGVFRILKYKKQMKRQKRISSDKVLTDKFRSLYELSDEEREYQFQPVRVIFDRVVDSILSKLPKKLRAKVTQKIERVKASIFD